MITLYTDGSCRGNPGPGGWAVVGLNPRRVWTKGYEVHTTNNRVEFLALINAMTETQKWTDKFQIISDSQLAVNILKGVWLPRANLDLVSLGKNLLISLNGRVSLEWQARDTDGIQYADRIAREMSHSNGNG